MTIREFPVFDAMDTFRFPDKPALSALHSQTRGRAISLSFLGVLAIVLALLLGLFIVSKILQDGLSFTSLLASRERSDEGCAHGRRRHNDYW